MAFQSDRPLSAFAGFGKYTGKATGVTRQSQERMDPAGNCLPGLSLSILNESWSTGFAGFYRARRRCAAPSSGDDTVENNESLFRIHSGRRPVCTGNGAAHGRAAGRNGARGADAPPGARRRGAARPGHYAADGFRARYELVAAVRHLYRGGVGLVVRHRVRDRIPAGRERAAGAAVLPAEAESRISLLITGNTHPNCTLVCYSEFAQIED